MGTMLSASNSGDQPRLLELLDEYLGGVEYCRFDEIPDIAPQFRDDKASGTLAHKLLANVIPFLNAEELGDGARLLGILEGLLRLKPSDEENENLVERISNVLSGPIRQLKLDGYELHCEYPIEHQFESGDVLSGSIDLLAQKGGEIRIYDFKSSAAACVSQSTKNQLLIYGGYLNMKNQNDVRAEAILI